MLADIRHRLRQLRCRAAALPQPIERDLRMIVCVPWHADPAERGWADGDVPGIEITDGHATVTYAGVRPDPALLARLRMRLTADGKEIVCHRG